ncbi:MAG: endolytic transglycosylase MltG [Candidatus Eisenbacteria bacterium]
MTPSRPGHGRFRPRRWAMLLGLAALGVVLFDLFMPAGPFPPPDRVVVLVQRGQNLRQIAEELRRVELLRGTLSFQVLARLMRLDRRVKAGQYAFRRGTSVPELLRLFSRGMGGLSLVRIPEGLTLTEVSLLLSNHLGVSAMAFDSLGRDRAFLDSLGVAAPNLEGYLAPNSYEFLPGTSPEVALRTMVKRQLAIVASQNADRLPLPLPLTPHQALTLASIVESESQAREERPRIARVYLNRLAMGMRLQADPTVAYSLGKVPRSRLFLSQLRHQSPYNTYMVDGLPPGPICNPGRASIAGVYHPVPPNEELYFVARGQGRHFFANTYEEHLANIRIARVILSTPRPGTPAADSAAKGEPPAPVILGPEGPPAKVEAEAPAKAGGLVKPPTDKR